MQLQEGITADQAIRALDQLVVDLENLRAMGGVPVDIAPDRYLGWVADAGRTLRNLFVDPDAAATLRHTPRYALVRQLETWSPRPLELINSEIEARAARLRELTAQLRSLKALADQPGAIVMPDTHVWLHYSRFDQVDWREIVGTETVQLVLPMPILEELDEKTYARRADLRRRAEKLLAALDPLVDRAPAGPVAVGEGVTLEVLPDGLADRGLPGQDAEILAAARSLQQAAGRPVTIVTGDRSMRVRAKGYGLAVCAMPDRLKKPLSSDTDEDEAADAGRVNSMRSMSGTCSERKRARWRDTHPLSPSQAWTEGGWRRR